MTWFRRKKPVPTVTNESFARWLRAWQPPWAVFHGLSEIEQEQMARLGDERADDLAVVLSCALSDPQGAADSVAASRGDMAAEESLARRVAADTIARIAASASRPAPVEPPRPTLAGIGERRAAAATAPGRGKSLFGRKADAP